MLRTVHVALAADQFVRRLQAVACLPTPTAAGHPGICRCWLLVGRLRNRWLPGRGWARRGALGCRCCIACRWRVHWRRWEFPAAAAAAAAAAVADVVTPYARQRPSPNSRVGLRPRRTLTVQRTAPSRNQTHAWNAAQKSRCAHAAPHRGGRDVLHVRTDQALEHV